jgi:hypothetical protein
MMFVSLWGRAQTLDYKLASFYVYNFTKYIDWPGDFKSGDFVIGVYGASPLTDELNKFVAGKHVGARSIVVKMFKSVEEAQGCQILFVPLSASADIKKISEAFKGKPVLLICEKEGLSKKGASISIFLDEDDDYKTKFEMNKEYIELGGLIISQTLMHLAAQVN